MFAPLFLILLNHRKKIKETERKKFEIQAHVLKFRLSEKVMFQLLKKPISNKILRVLLCVIYKNWLNKKKFQFTHKNC